MSLQPFTIDIPQSVLDDLHTRLAHTRWPDQIEGAEWNYGTDLGYMKELTAYWLEHFDWRAQEARLNQFTQFRTEVDGFGIHFIYERGKGPKPFPLVITHGWPGSFYEMYKIIPLLADPAQHGGDAADEIYVIDQSFPRYIFSNRPKKGGMNQSRTAELWTRLMTEELGYARFGATGGDIGSGVTQRMALAHPDLLAGIYLNFLGNPVNIPEQSELSPAEQHYLQGIQQWSDQEGGYIRMQATKPQTLAYGLNDSPTGLAAWIIEKFRSWSDCGGDIERSFSKDELLTNIMIYWVTETIGSSVHMYYENRRDPLKLAPGQHIEVPTGFALFPQELSRPPRELAERILRIARWTNMPRGGHFAALEEPQLLAEELRAFFRPLRPKD